MVLRIDTEGMDEERKFKIMRLLCVYAARKIIDLLNINAYTDTIYFGYNKGVEGLETIKSKLGCELIIIG